MFGVDSAEPGAAILPEEKIMFSVHAHAMSLMTIAKIRKIYTTTDAKSIAKQLAMSPRENATPIRILHNSAAHLSGSARSFGAILMGYLGEYLDRFVNGERWLRGLSIDGTVVQSHLPAF